MAGSIGGGELSVAILLAPPPSGKPGRAVPEEQRSKYIQTVREACRKAGAVSNTVSPGRNANAIVEQVHGYGATHFVLTNCPEGAQALPLLNSSVRIAVVIFPSLKNPTVKYPEMARIFDFSLEPEKLEALYADLLEWLTSEPVEEPPQEYDAGYEYQEY